MFSKAPMTLVRPPDYSNSVVLGEHIHGGKACQEKCVLFRDEMIRIEHVVRSNDDKLSPITVFFPRKCGQKLKLIQLW